ncbi:hypothetical protein F4802DRAFT_63227 [Xylaria palmicola]|nr:hypothetical protein F4802DRAFT_63227 [Xylaria palmicola]
MDPNDMPRQSTDSARSTSPFIQRPAPQPPNYPKGYDKVKGYGATTKVKVSVMLMVLRTLAAITGFAIAIGFATTHIRRDVTIVLIVFTWLSAVWNALMLIRLRKPLRMSLVLSDGKTIRFGSHDNDEADSPKRRNCMRAFWIDLILASAVFSLNIANIPEGRGRLRTFLLLNFLPTIFHIFITLVGMSPRLLNAHFRFESVESPQIALP